MRDALEAVASAAAAAAETATSPAAAATAAARGSSVAGSGCDDAVATAGSPTATLALETKTDSSAVLVVKEVKPIGAILLATVTLPAVVKQVRVCEVGGRVCLVTFFVIRDRANGPTHEQ